MPGDAGPGCIGVPQVMMGWRQVSLGKATLGWTRARGGEEHGVFLLLLILLLHHHNDDDGDDDDDDDGDDHLSQSYIYSL